MDLELSEDQKAMADLAGRIMSERLTLDRLREIELADQWFARDVWEELAKADLLGLCLPEDVGGGGYGFFEACLLLEQQGRTVAPLPLLATLVLGALPIARFGSAEQKKAWLPGVIDGSVVLTGAFFGGASSSVQGKVDGEYLNVPAADLASRILVPVGTAVFLVDPSDDGVTIERNTAMNDQSLFTVRLAGAEAELLAEDGCIEWVSARAVAGLCSIEVGLCDAALGITSTYVSEREQFGSKIGTFQAVAQRLADAYIDTEAIRLTALQAAWRLSEELPADDEVDIAKFWAADGGHRVVHACQHVHGGIGVDLDYPVHRYFRWTKVIEFTLGSATDHLRAIGERIATTAT